MYKPAKHLLYSVNNMKDQPVLIRLNALAAARGEMVLPMARQLLERAIAEEITLVGGISESCAAEALGL